MMIVILHFQSPVEIEIQWPGEPNNFTPRPDVAVTFMAIRKARTYGSNVDFQHQQ